jgi:uncharacterized coiled-coil DUF342 family protein
MISEIKRPKEGRLSPKAHFIAVLCFGGLGTFILSYLSLPTWITLATPSATILYYSIYSYKLDSIDRDVDGLHHHAEQIYLLGYLLTLFAIFGVALTPQGEVSDLMKAAAVKLLASLAGITAMLILKEISHGWEQDQTNKQELFEHDIGRRISNFQGDLDSLSTQIKALEKIINADFFEETAAMIHGFRSTVELSSQEVGQTISLLSGATKRQQEDLTAITKSFTQAHSDFAQNHNDNLDSFQQTLSGSLSKYSGTHHDLIESIHEHQQQLGHELREQLKEVINQTQSFKDHFEGFTGSMKQSSASLTTHSEGLREVMEESMNASRSLNENINSLDVDQAKESIIQLATAISQTADRFKTLGDYDKKLKDATVTQTNLHQEYINNLQELVPSSREHQNQIAKLALEAQSLVEGLCNTLAPENMRLKESADHIQDMTNNLSNIMSKLEPNSLEIGQKKDIATTDSPRRFGNFFGSNRS